MVLPVKPGQIVAGKYRVDRVLGSGGMGVVVAARNLVLDQRVALKFMHNAALSDEDTVARFLREARAVARLRGEHVARVFDVGTLEDGSPYIVMEFLEGRDAAALLQARGSLPVSEACDLVLQACVAMAEAHRHGIVHRDLKPQNLFLTKRPDGAPLVKVLDFGISKVPRQLAGAGDETGSDVLMGSPAYMSPEQMRSAKDVDVRTDVWALGVILFQLVSGAMPFLFESVAVLCAKVLGEAHRPLRSVAPEAPAGFAALVDRCLAKDPEGRFAGVAELAEALAPFASARGRALVDSIRRLADRELTADDPLREDPAVDSQASTVSQAPATLVDRARRAASRRGVQIVAAAVTLAALAGGLYVLRGGQPAPETTHVARPATPPHVEPSVTPLPAPPPTAVVASAPAPAPPVAPVVSAPDKPRGGVTHLGRATPPTVARPASAAVSAPGQAVAPPDAGDPFRSGPQ